MAERALMVLPPKLRIYSAEAEPGRTTIPLDVSRLRIIGFTDADLPQTGTDVPIWPVPLIQLDYEPRVILNQITRFNGLGYNAITKLVRPELVKDDDQTLVTFSSEGHGRAGQVINDATFRAIRIPKGYARMGPTERRELTREMYDKAVAEHGALYQHNLDAYLFPDGPATYNQPMFQEAVEATIDKFNLDTQL
jgi:hypothetical protein